MTTTEWAVDVTFALPHPLEEMTLDTLSDRFDELDWTVATMPDGSLSVFGYGEGKDPFEAATMVVDIARHVLVEACIPDEPVKITVLTEEQRERECLSPQIPELLAAADIGRLLGISRQRVNQLHQSHSQFPRPVMRTGAGSLWSRSAVDWFISIWDRRPGRPSESGSQVAKAVTNLGQRRSLRSRCEAVTQRGSRCHFFAMEGRAFCHVHDRSRLPAKHNVRSIRDRLDQTGAKGSDPRVVDRQHHSDRQETHSDPQETERISAEWR